MEERTKMENKTKKLLAVGGTALIALSGLAGAGLHAANAEPVIVTEYKNVTVEKLVEVPVEVEVEKIVEIPVDNENLDLVLDHIYDNDGNVEYLLDDLDDDEIAEIVDRIIFINYMKKIAVDKVKADGIDELHKEYIGDVKIDEDDIERFKIYDDDEDLIVDDVDFEDSDGEILVKVRFQLDDDDNKYGAEFKVSFEDGEFDDLDLVDSYLRE